MYSLKKRFTSLVSVLTLSAISIVVPGNSQMVNAEETKEKDSWTFGLYLCGSDLESFGGKATDDIMEILNAKVDKKKAEDVNIIIETGGAMEWHYKEKYGEKLLNDGLSESEVDRIIPSEIDEKTISQYRVNYFHEYETDEGETKTVPALEFIKDVGTYSEAWFVTPEDENDGDYAALEDDKYNYVSMGDYITFSEFLEDINENHPADHMAIDIWNHGSGIEGGVCFDEVTEYDSLSLDELRNSFGANVSENTRYDLIGLDACLMSGYELWAEFSKYAKYGVGSILLEPADGWYYTPFVEEMVEKSDDKKYTGKELSKGIVKAFDDYYLEDEEEDTTLCSFDLDKLKESVPIFDYISSALLRTYSDKEGVKKVNELAQSNMIAGAQNLLDMENFFNKLGEYAQEREADFYDAGSMFEDVCIGGSYSRIALYMEDFLKSIEDSKVAISRNYMGDEYGDMSIFFPQIGVDTDYYFFDIEEYPDYSVSKSYAAYTLFMSELNEIKLSNCIYDSDVQFDLMNNKILFNIPEMDGPTIYDAIVDKYVEVDGKYYLANVASPYLKATNQYAANTVDSHFSINGKPLYSSIDEFEDDDNEKCVSATFPVLVNGVDARLGVYNNTDDKSFQISYVFSLDGSLDLEYLKPGDEIEFYYNVHKELSANTGADEGEQEPVVIKLKESDFSYNSHDGIEEKCVKLPLEFVKDGSSNVKYVIKAFHSYFDYETEEELCEIINRGLAETFLVDYNKLCDYANDKISVEKNEYEVTGENIEPTILFDGKKDKFKLGTDYEVEYINNLGIGKATAVVKGIGDCAFVPEKRVDFNIVKYKNKDGKVVYVTQIIEKPERASVKSLKNTKNKACKVKWKKIKNADGYELCIARNKKFTKDKKVKTIKKAGKTTYTFKKLKKNKRYFVRVRAYVTGKDGKKYFGKWSVVKKVKIKK